MDVSLALGLLIFLLPELHLLRNHVGDALAVMFIFSFLALLVERTATIACVTLGLAVGLEIVQALAVIKQQTFFSDLLLGYTFDPIDLIVYTFTVMALGLLHRKLNPT